MTVILAVACTAIILLAAPSQLLFPGLAQAQPLPLPAPSPAAGPSNLFLPLLRLPESSTIPPALTPEMTLTPSPSATAAPGSTTTPTPTATSAPGTTATPTATATATATGFLTTTTTPTATPTPSAPTWWQPSPDQPIAWHWQLSEDFVYPRDVLAGVTVYDLDGELTSAATVAQLHALGPNIIVICYFDAGVYEDYRSDAAAFPPSVIGNPDEGWEGSYWLDIRQIDILRPIMENRVKTWCKDKGFDAIEPDETEVWSNDSGFPITKAQNNAYNQMIAELAHSYGLSVGLKGNTTETGELVEYFDWTLNEQCWEFSECDLIYASFIQAGKAAFNIEYDATPDCEQANQWHLNSARRDLNLVGPTHPDYLFEPCIPYSQDTWE